MFAQGAPEVPKWSRKVPKMEPPGLTNGNREELKGAGGRWRSLKIRRTLARAARHNII